MNTSGVDRASVGLRSQRGPVLLAVMLSTALVALVALDTYAAVLQERYYDKRCMRIFL